MAFGGFGGFGAAQQPPSPFGAAQQPHSGAFGATGARPATTGAFGGGFGGQGAASGGFGSAIGGAGSGAPGAARAVADACKFWNRGSCKFGARCNNKHCCSKCGSTAHRAVSCSMTPGVSGYRATRVMDKELLTPGTSYAMVHSISAMPENLGKSAEEIRAAAYASADQPATSAGGFGAPAATSPFGGTTGGGSAFESSMNCIRSKII